MILEARCFTKGLESRLELGSHLKRCAIAFVKPDVATGLGIGISNF